MFLAPFKQLRVLWKSTVNELSDYVGAGLSSDVSQIVSNPYYLKMMMREADKQTSSHFGRIVNSPSESTQTSRMPGQFNDYSLPDRELGADFAFGQVIYRILTFI